jgi:hypothetical protein
MKTCDNYLSTKRRVRSLVAFFIVALVISGITAFPIQTLLDLVLSVLTAGDGSAMKQWLERVQQALRHVNEDYPFLPYGTDWLAFAHIVIAVFFIGAWREPVRNKWIITAGLIACAGIFPLAFIAGYVRHVPFFWQLIDCLFGFFGGLLLWYIQHLVKRLEVLSAAKLPQG